MRTTSKSDEMFFFILVNYEIKHQVIEESGSSDEEQLKQKDEKEK